MKKTRKIAFKVLFLIYVIYKHRFEFVDMNVVYEI